MATSSATFWQGVERVLVTCVGSPGVDSRTVADICGRVKQQAQTGAPIPVVQSAGGTSATARDVVLKVSITGNAAGIAPRGVNVAITAERSDPRSESSVSTWRRPGAAAVPNLRQAASGSIDDIVAAELDFALPWRTVLNSGRKLSRG